MGLEVYANNVRTFRVEVGGSVTFGQVATNYGNAYWNQSNKRLEFRGGTAGTVVQAYIDTDGSIGAGGSTPTILMNADGLSIFATDSFYINRSLSFIDDGTDDDILNLYSVSEYLTDSLFLENVPRSGQDARLFITMDTPGAEQAEVKILAGAKGIDIVSDVGTSVTGNLAGTGSLTIGGSGYFYVTSGGIIQKSVPIRLRIYASSSAAKSAGSWQGVAFNTENWDTDGMHGGSAQSSTIQREGLYSIQAQIEFSYVSGAYYASRLRYYRTSDGSTLTIATASGVHSTTHSYSGYLTVSSEWYFSPGDYFWVEVFCTSAFNVVASYPYSPHMMASRIA